MDPKSSQRSTRFTTNKNRSRGEPESKLRVVEPKNNARQKKRAQRWDRARQRSGLVGEGKFFGGKMILNRRTRQGEDGAEEEYTTYRLVYPQGTSYASEARLEKEWLKAQRAKDARERALEKKIGQHEAPSKATQNLGYLQEKQGSAEAQAESALQQMAANNLIRVGAPKALVQALRDAPQRGSAGKWSHPVPEKLLKLCGTEGCAAAAFNAAAAKLRSSDVWNFGDTAAESCWECTRADATNRWGDTAAAKQLTPWQQAQHQRRNVCPCRFCRPSEAACVLRLQTAALGEERFGEAHVLETSALDGLGAMLAIWCYRKNGVGGPSCRPWVFGFGPALFNAKCDVHREHHVRRCLQGPGLDTGECAARLGGVRTVFRVKKN